jgi:hypothetical protein
MPIWPGGSARCVMNIANTKAGRYDAEKTVNIDPIILPSLNSSNIDDTAAIAETITIPNASL